MCACRMSCASGEYGVRARVKKNFKSSKENFFQMTLVGDARERERE